MSRLEDIYRDRPQAASFARGYLDYLSEIFDLLDADAIAGAIQELLDAREREARIFFIGNGGSAATASHFANDLAIANRPGVKPFRAVSLTDNVTVLTAIANDSGYERVFAQQLETQLVPGDLVVAISVSGNSPNVLAGVAVARTKGARIVALTGFDGGALRGLADVAVHVPTNPGEYGPAEDVHMVFDHLIASFLLQSSKPDA